MKKINEELSRPMSEFNDMTPKDALEEVKSLVQGFAEEFDYDIDERVCDAIKRLSVLVDDVSRLDEKATVIEHVEDTTVIDECPARQMAARLLADDDSLSPDDYYKVEDYFTSILNGNEAEMPNINYLKCAAKQKVNLTLEELTDKYKIAGEIVRNCKNEFVDAVVEEIEETYLKNDCFPTKDCITKLVLSFLAYQEYLDKCLYKNKKPYTYEMFMSQIFKHNRICKEYGLSKFKN